MIGDTKYFIFYDRTTGKIQAVSLNKEDSPLSFLEVNYEIYEKFVTGKNQFSNFLIAGSPPTVVEVSAQGCDFKNKAFEWIVESSTSKPSLSVTWNFLTKSWEFSISASVKKEASRSGSVGDLVFFITLKNDLDFLIRTISISITELINSKTINIPFSSNFEQDIDKISIASVRVFESYGLKVKYE